MSLQLRSQQGSVATEAAILAPVLLLLLMLVVYVGRVGQVDADTRMAAARAARAASLQADPAVATTVATDVAATNLQTAGIVCTQLTVTVDTGAFHAGGRVGVEVACQITNADLTLLAVPGTRWSIAQATQPIDTYRGGG